MRKLNDEITVGPTLRALRFAAIRLRSRPTTAALAGEVKAARQELTQEYDAFLEAREERIAATAEVTYLDEKLDLDVSRTSREALTLADGKTTDPRYRAAFPTAPSPIMAEMATRPQERYVRGIIDALKNEPGLQGLIAHATTLEADLDLLNKALAQREDLYVPESRAQGRYQAALDKAKRVYNLLYPRLQLLFPDDPTLVESFFATLKSGKSEKTDDAEDPKADTTSPA